MKRVLALFLSLLFVMTLLPAVSLAEDTFVVTPPSKTTYVRGEAYDASGFAVLYNGTDVTALSTVDISSTYYDGSKFVKSGTTNVTVTYNNTLTSTFELKIVDYRVDGMTITAPTKMAYTVGEALDPTGIVVTPKFTYYNTSANTLVSKAQPPVAWSATTQEQFTFSPAVFSEVSTDAAVSVKFTGTYNINGEDTALTFTDSFSGIVVAPKLADTLSIDNPPYELLVGYPYTVTAKVEPADATDTYTWTSSEPAVATVVADSADPLKAVITPVADGVADITVDAVNGAGNDVFSVKVVSKPTSVQIMEGGAAITNYNILEGSEHKLTVRTEPAAAEMLTHWVLVDGAEFIDKAVFEATGTLVALKEGVANVKATCMGLESQVVSINVIDAATADKRYDSIEIEGLANRYFMVGDYFNPSVLDVRAYVSNEANDETLGDVLPLGTFQYSITNVNNPSTKRSGVCANPFNAAGTAKVTVYYTFKYQNSDGTWSTKTLSDSAEIYVYYQRPFMVVIGEAPYTTTYYKGETLDTAGLSVKVAYTTDGFEVAAPEISKYESLTIDTVSMPDLYKEITAEDVAAGYKDYKISYKDGNGLAAEPALLTVTALPPVGSISMTPEALEFEYEDISAVATRFFQVQVPAGTPESALGWDNSNSKVASYKATYDASTGLYSVEVTPLAPGNTKISVRARGGSRLFTCEVTVKGNPEEDVLAMKLNYNKYTLFIGDTYALIPIFTPTTSYDDVSWSIETKTVDNAFDEAEFIKTGMMKGLREGVYVVRATTVNALDNNGNPFTDTCEVTVKGIAVDNMTIEPTAMSLFAGSYGDITAVVTPDTATDKTVAWSSSDETSAVEYVKNGVATGVGADPIVTVQSINGNSARVMTNYENFIAYCETKGVSTYEATVYGVAYGGLTKTCKVTVQKGTLLNDLTLNKHSVELGIGATLELVPTLNPVGATNKVLEWTSSNPAIATVDESGLVKAISPGAATITCAATDGSGEFDTCVIQISSVLIQSITISPYVSTINEDATLQLVANLFPGNVTSTKVTWSSSDENIATVNANGLVTGTGGGVAVIRATSADGSNIYGTAVVAVKAKIPVKSVDVKIGNFELLLGDSTVLAYTLSPSDATNNGVTWRSSDTSVATVDKDGKIVGLKTGTTNVTATCGGKSDTITVTVVSSLTRVGKVVNCSRRVNVRASASGTSKQMGYAYLGTLYKVLGKVGNWYKIQLSETKVAYIWANYLEISSTSASYVSAGSVTGSAGSTGGSSVTNPTKVTITNCNEFVNVRSGPGTSNTKLGTAPLNATYTYLATEGDWIKLLYENQTAYIYKDYCLLG